MARSLQTSLLTLVAANAVVAAMALVGWLGAREVLLVYWMESAVIGLYAIARMAIAAKAAAFFLVPFFCIHAGIFMLVHFVFILVLGGELRADGTIEGMADGLRQDLVNAAWAALIFVASHGVSLVRHRDEASAQTKPNPVGLMGGFYGRIVLMQLTLLIGAWPTIALGSPAWAVVLLVALKTVVDGYVHVRKHRREAAEAAKLAAATPSQGTGGN